MNAVFTPGRLRITIERYQRMGEAGVLAPDERVELIEGEILGMAPIGARHLAITTRLLKRFILAVGDAAIVTAGNPVDLGDASQPEPDLLVLRPRPDDYMRSHPRAADAVLLIEVSDSSLGFDQGPKRDLYAKFGIAEYWVIDVNDPRIVVYLDPVQGAFQRTREVRGAESLSPQALPNVKLTVSELFA